MRRPGKKLEMAGGRQKGREEDHKGTRLRRSHQPPSQRWKEREEGLRGEERQRRTIREKEPWAETGKERFERRLPERRKESYTNRPWEEIKERIKRSP